MISQDDKPIEKVKKAGILYTKGCLFAFAALVIGFIVFALFKSTIQPRLTSGIACNQNDGCQLALLNGRAGVRILGYSPDGSFILTAGADTLIHNATTGDKVAELDPDFDSHFDTIIAGDGSLIAALNTRENGVEFFTPDGQPVDGWYWPEERDLQDFAFLPRVDGFALSGQDGITMWRMEDGEQFATLPGSEGAGLMVASANGAWLAAYNREADAIYIWPLAQIDEGIVIHEVDIFDAFVRDDALQISADGSRVASFSAATASVWNTADGALIFSTSLEKEGIGIDHIGLSANGQRLAIGYDDGGVEVWEIEGAQLLQIFEHRQALNGVALSPDGTQVAVGQSGDSVVTESLSPQDFSTEGNVYIDTIPGYALVCMVEDRE